MARACDLTSPSRRGHDASATARMESPAQRASGLGERRRATHALPECRANCLGHEPCPGCPSSRARPCDEPLRRALSEPGGAAHSDQSWDSRALPGCPHAEPGRWRRTRPLRASGRAVAERAGDAATGAPSAGAPPAGLSRPPATLAGSCGASPDQAGVPHRVPSHSGGALVLPSTSAATRLLETAAGSCGAGGLQSSCRFPLTP